MGWFSNEEAHATVNEVKNSTNDDIVAIALIIIAIIAVLTVLGKFMSKQLKSTVQKETAREVRLNNLTQAV